MPDRNALEQLIQRTRYSRGANWTTERLADTILLLCELDDGAQLTSEEVKIVLGWFQVITDLGGTFQEPSLRLAARLRGDKA